MNERIIICVADIIGGSLCFSAEDGQRVFDKMKPLLMQDKKITISFEWITTLLPFFLNVSVGQLYGTFTEEQVRTQVEVDGLKEGDVEMLERVIVNAKKYYSNKKNYDTAWAML